MSDDVRWGDVEGIAEEAFHIWTGSPDAQWARLAWGHLAEAGLTAGATGLERTAAYVRFLVLASFYRDWCTVVWDEVEDDCPALWLSGIDYDRFYVGQLLGPDKEPNEDSDGDPIDDALRMLIRRERPAVVKTLVAGFGGTDGLFVSLWQSNRDPTTWQQLKCRDAQAQTARTNGPTTPAFGPEPALESDHMDSGHAFEDEDDSDDDPFDERPEDLAQILNNFTEEKLAGYTWISLGCRCLGPTRSWSEM